MAKRKCLLCGKYIDTEEESIPYKGRYVHKNCFNVIMKNNAMEQKNKERAQESKVKNKNKKSYTPQAELKGALSEEEYKQKKQFYAKLKEVLNTDTLEPKYYSVAEYYIKRYKFTWKGMTNALFYYYDVLEKEKGNCLYIIMDNYTKADRFFNSINNNNLTKDKPPITVSKTITLKKNNSQNNMIDVEKFWRK